MTKLDALYAAGQSVWLDFIQRDMLENGDLADLVSGGIRGLTSNPTIFQNAIAESSLYDSQILDVTAGEPNATAATVFERLAIEDIRNASDELGNVYEDSDRTDGFVSLEISPRLAHDTTGTVAEAHRLRNLVNRDNLMIKVPATAAGVLALEELTAAGINVNATLMFSLDSYEAIAAAYVRGLRRAEHPVAVASVASFFVSRVDSKTDAALEKVGTAEAMNLRGKIAVANAKMAYRRYQEIFESDDFGDQTRRGARPQRVLWASTSTKNPDYHDVLYVDSLIGANTVNTLPRATIAAFKDHGRIDPGALTTGVDEARSRVEALGPIGIDFGRVTDELQTEGVHAFADSYEDLLSTLADKMHVMRE